MIRTALSAFVVTAVLAACGCGSNQAYITDINMRIVKAEYVNKKEPNAAYVVDPPDVLRLESDSVPELTPPREVTVRQDGFISAPLLQDVKVGGLSPAAIKQKLEEGYAKYYKEPQVTVTVAAYNSKSIYVYGEINFPGRSGKLPYTGMETVAGAIGAVGGFTYRAAPNRVIVSRADLEAPEVFKVDLNKLFFEGDAAQNVVLAQNDVVFVPPNHFAWVGYQIENILFPFTSAADAAVTYSAISRR